MSTQTKDPIIAKTFMSGENQPKPLYFDFPFGVKVANKLLSGYKNKPLNQDELIERAIKKAGLDDFGDMFWMEPMKVALEDLNKSTNFHPLGAYIYEQKVVLNLVNRLWSQYWLKEEPSIRKELPPSVMITGLQRTGTTFLQRLLGSLPEFRGTISWELMNPVPISKKKSYYGKYQAWGGHKALNYISPEFKAIHAVNHNSLEEEQVLMEHCYMSSVLEAAMTVPNYSRWLEEQDQKVAYKDLKMWLQFLLWRKPAKEYLLMKSPHHMEYLEDFSSVFPNTKIIYTHRSPRKTMASFCSMIHLSKKYFQPSSDPVAVGAHWLRKNQRLVEHCHNFRKDNSEMFFDVPYKHLIEDPVNCVKGIYKELNLEWTPEHPKMVEDYCQEHRKNKFGRHEYKLEDYGLNNKTIDNAFGEYLEAYKDLL